MQKNLRYFLELSYDGTNYAGWQRQPNVSTVQGCIEEALQLIIKEPTPIYGCGRTDRGVHAKNYIAHLELAFDCPISPKDILYKLNRILDKDIALHRLFAVEQNAHARFDALSRTYEYSFHTNKSPFLGVYSTFVRDSQGIDYSVLKIIEEIIHEQTDFTSFCKLHGAEGGNLCRIDESVWTVDEEEGRLFYKITANRFLRGMVRLIVGSTLNVARGKLSLVDFKNHIKSGTRSPLMKSAPPQGLSLIKIQYPYI